MLKVKLKKLLQDNIWIILILIVSAFLRLYRIGDYLTFLGDEGRDVLVVYNILHGHLTLLGPTSSVGGFFLGPIYYYFMAPFLLLFNYNPVGPAVMVALFGIATVGLLYKFSKELFNQKVGLIAASLYAISPLVISYSRSSWNPNVVPFFSLLTLYVLYKAMQKEKLKYIFVVGILLGILMQLHYLALFLAVTIFAYIFLINFKSFKLLVKKYFILIVGFIIGWSPFLAFEIRHGFMDFKNISNFILHSGNTGAGGNFLTTVSDVFFRLFARLIFNFPDKNQLASYSTQIASVWIIFICILAFISIFFLLNNLVKAKKDYKKYALLFLWLILGIGLFGLYKKQIYDYYFTFMFPLPFIIIANLLSFIISRKRIFAFLGYVLIISLIFINLSGIPFRHEPNRQLNQMQSISDFVYSKTQRKPFNFAIITGGNSDHAYRYFFTVWGLPPVTIENSQNDPQRKTVTDQLFVVCESLPCEPRGHSLWEIAGFGRAEIAGHWKYSHVEIYKLIHYKEN